MNKSIVGLLLLLIVIISLNACDNTGPTPKGDIVNIQAKFGAILTGEKSNELGSTLDQHWLLIVQKVDLERYRLVGHVRPWNGGTEGINIYNNGEKYNAYFDDLIYIGVLKNEVGNCATMTIGDINQIHGVDIWQHIQERTRDFPGDSNLCTAH